MFPVALPDCESDLVGLGLDQPNVHIHMANILRKSSAGPSDHDDSRLDGDCYTIRYLQFFSCEDITHLPEAGVSNAMAASGIAFVSGTSIEQRS